MWKVPALYVIISVLTLPAALYLSSITGRGWHRVVAGSMLSMGIIMSFLGAGIAVWLAVRFFTVLNLLVALVAVGIAVAWCSAWVFAR